MFEINGNLKVNKFYINNSIIFTIDNFYKFPDKILNLFLKVSPPVHKKSKKTYNTIFFDDRRHIFECDELIKVNQFLISLCKQKSTHYENIGFTNVTTFKNKCFNDYENNYWWPHLDGGYNGILYLNPGDDVCGTNLYEPLDLDNDPPKNMEEHEQPWRKKEKYKLIHQIKPKYNRMVLFDGLKFFHGMNISKNYYFYDMPRINQVFFFEQDKNHTSTGPPKSKHKLKVFYS